MGTKTQNASLKRITVGGWEGRAGGGDWGGSLWVSPIHGRGDEPPLEYRLQQGKT